MPIEVPNSPHLLLISVRTYIPLQHIYCRNVSVTLRLDIGNIARNIAEMLPLNCYVRPVQHCRIYFCNIVSGYYSNGRATFLRFYSNGRATFLRFYSNSRVTFLRFYSNGRATFPKFYSNRPATFRAVGPKNRNNGILYTYIYNACVYENRRNIIIVHSMTSMCLL